jgi:hypothetical protein
MAVTITVIAFVIFLAGATAGILTMVSIGIRQEEQDFTLTCRAPGRMSQGTRLLTGLYVRQRADAPAPLDRPDALV